MALTALAVAQFEAAADRVGLDDDARTRLRQPRRSLTVNFPVHRDSGEVEVMTGYRVQHTLAMGPTKGGVRFAPGVSLGECSALAMWMTFKCDVRAAIAWVGEHGFLRDFPAADAVSQTEVLETPCEMLIPAALECQITEDNAPLLDCQIVVEAANGPTTPEGDEILAERGIRVIPDVLTNAGLQVP